MTTSGDPTMIPAPRDLLYRSPAGEHFAVLALGGTPGSGQPTIVLALIDGAPVWCDPVVDGSHLCFDQGPCPDQYR